MLAESAVPLAEIDRAEVEGQIATLEQEVTDALGDEERAGWQAQLQAAEAMLACLRYHGDG